MGLAQHAGDSVLGAGADLGRCGLGRVEHAHGLLTEELGEVAGIERVGDRPLHLVESATEFGLPLASAAHLAGELEQVALDLDGVEAATHGRELVLDDAIGIEGFVARHRCEWYRRPLPGRVMLGLRNGWEPAGGPGRPHRDEPARRARRRAW